MRSFAVLGVAAAAMILAVHAAPADELSSVGSTTVSGSTMAAKRQVPGLRSPSEFAAARQRPGSTMSYHPAGGSTKPLVSVKTSNDGSPAHVDLMAK